MTQPLFFWGGPFSQWTPSPFVVDDVAFNCAEQWMMWKKACLFGDARSARAILATNNPKAQKAIGRGVAGFDEAIWNTACDDIVFDGNYAKFSQSQTLRKLLLDSGDRLIVEASPFDRIWGIGLDAPTARRTPQGQWPGQNKLGKAIMRVRDALNSERTLVIEL